MRCAKCDFDNPTGMRFCGQCGAPLARVCARCGAENPPSFQFCGACGAGLAAPVAAAAKSTGPEAQFSTLQQAPPAALRDHLLTPAEGELRLVTLLFADMTGSVATTAGLDPEDAAHLVSRLLNTMVAAVTKYGGHVDRFLGDGVLAVFGAPQAHEDDPERAIHAALAIREASQELGLNVTAGINTGPVYVGEVGGAQHQERTVMGPAVNLASRLQAEAAPGQILVGAATYRPARGAFQFAPLSLAVKGIARPVVAYAVQRVLPRPEKVRGIAGLRAELIGRDAEFARLQAAWGELLQGRGQVVSLIGEAGLGKSRLVAELRSGTQAFGRSGVQDRPDPTEATDPSNPERLNARTPERPILWLEGRCLELSMATSYAPFLDLFREHFGLGTEDDDPIRAARLTAGLERLEETGSLARERVEEIAPLLGQLLSVRFGDARDERLPSTDPGELKRQTFLAIRDYLVALGREQPLVLVLEDLHWADHLSLELISLLREALPQAPLLVLCLYRPEREHPCWHLGAQAQQQCPERYTEISLRELTPADSRRLVESLLAIENLSERVKELILAKARGNPFFVEEVVRSLVDAGLVYREEELWRAREGIEHLQVPDTVQSVILSRVDRLEPELKRVLESAAVIGRLFRRRVLEAVLGVQAFGRSGVQDPSRPSEPSEPEPLNARTPERLNACLQQLEERQLIYEERALPEAEYSFKHVLTQETIYHSLLKERRALFHLRVAEALEALYADGLEEYYEPLAHHYERAGDQEKAIDYLLKAGERARRLSADAEAIQHYQGALRLLEGLPEDEAHWKLRWQATSELAGTHRHRLEWEPSRQVLEEYRARAERAGCPWGIAAAHIELTRHFHREVRVRGSGDIERARRHAETSLALCEREGLADLLPLVRYHLAECLQQEPGSDLPRAAALLRQELDRRAGLLPWQVQQRYGLLAEVSARLGQWDETMATLREIFAAGVEAGAGLNSLEEGLEAQGRQAEFIAFCDETRRLLAQTGTADPLAQWYLVPAQPSARFRQVAFQDDFEEPVLREEWQWCDPLQASAYHLGERAGCLTLHAAEGTDLAPWAGIHAPRLLLEVRGDFALEARMEGDWDARDRIGSSGLLVWKDHRHFLRLEKFCMGFHYGSVGLQAMIQGEFRMVGRGLLRGSAFHLRLEREGERFTALCSTDGIHWLTCGQVAFPARDPLRVGIVSLRGVVAHFDWVRVLTKP